MVIQLHSERGPELGKDHRASVHTNQWKCFDTCASDQEKHTSPGLGLLPKDTNQPDRLLAFETIQKTADNSLKMWFNLIYNVLNIVKQNKQIQIFYDNSSKEAFQCHFTCKYMTGSLRVLDKSTIVAHTYISKTRVIKLNYFYQKEKDDPPSNISGKSS